MTVTKFLKLGRKKDTVNDSMNEARERKAKV